MIEPESRMSSKEFPAKKKKTKQSLREMFPQFPYAEYVVSVVPHI